MIPRTFRHVLFLTCTILSLLVTAHGGAAEPTHWAFQPPRDHPLPGVRRAELVQSPIDRFILARLEKEGLAPSAKADKRTLLRRATLDLIGLPPTAEEVEAFLADDSPDAFAKVIERLLASPHYGERWGRHWLDVARYADTKGYVYTDREERRFIHSHVYRDWVIRAFNQDLPYDQFLIQQIAADQLAGPDDRQPLAALGFLTLGRRFAGNFYEIIDDRIDTLCRATLGLTVSCARCHDHKFDPIPIADYYSLYGVFSGSYDAPLPLVDQPERTAEYVAYEEELKRRQKAFDEALAAKSEETLNRVRARTAEYLAALVEVETLPTEHEYRILGADDLNPVYVRQWHAFLERPRDRFDPIFAPWLAMAKVPEKDLPSGFSEWMAEFAGQLNPRIAAALDGPPPKSKKELAQRIGRVFEQVQQAWQAAVQAAIKNKGKLPERITR